MEEKQEHEITKTIKDNFTEFVKDALNAATQPSYVISVRYFCASTMGIEIFKELIDEIDGVRIIGDDTLEKVKEYIKELAKDINKQYSDADLVLSFYEHWHGKYNFGFYVYSDYCDWPVCEIFFLLKLARPQALKLRKEAQNENF